MTIGDDGIATRDNTGASWKKRSDPQKDIAMLGPAFWLNEIAEYIERDAVREWADMASILRALAADAQVTQDRYHAIEMSAISEPRSNFIKARFGD